MKTELTAYYNMVGFAFYTCPPLMMALCPYIFCRACADYWSGQVKR